MNDMQTKMVNGYVWPETDTDCLAVVFTTTGDLDLALSYVKTFDVAVQAGGNCGVWPKHLAKRFAVVHTVEAEPTNAACLTANCQESNIVVYHAALGYERTSVGMRYPEGDRNMGACCVSPHGSIPVMRIDDLQLPACDFIQLDLEGYEVEAIKGAAATIAQFHPVLMIEDKGLTQDYGYEASWTQVYFQDHGYVIVASPNRDVILVHQP